MQATAREKDQSRRVTKLSVVIQTAMKATMSFIQVIGTKHGSLCLCSHYTRHIIWRFGGELTGLPYYFIGSRTKDTEANCCFSGCLIRLGQTVSNDIRADKLTAATAAIRI